MSALLTQSPGDTVQTGTGKVDPARKFKCTMAARGWYTVAMQWILRSQYRALYPNGVNKLALYLFFRFGLKKTM